MVKGRSLQFQYLCKSNPTKFTNVSEKTISFILHARMLNTLEVQSVFLTTYLHVVASSKRHKRSNAQRAEKGEVEDISIPIQIFSCVTGEKY